MSALWSRLLYPCDWGVRWRKWLCVGCWRDWMMKRVGMGGGGNPPGDDAVSGTGEQPSSRTAQDAGPERVTAYPARHPSEPAAEPTEEQAEAAASYERPEDIAAEPDVEALIESALRHARKLHTLAGGDMQEDVCPVAVIAPRPARRRGRMAQTDIPPLPEGVKK